jgi:hypothetical protein
MPAIPIRRIRRQCTTPRASRAVARHSRLCRSLCVKMVLAFPCSRPPLSLLLKVPAVACRGRLSRDHPVNLHTIF